MCKHEEKQDVKMLKIGYNISILAHSVHTSFLANRCNFSCTDLVRARDIYP